ncbi:hypothetical protein AcV5_010097 [Taiwanofungus camphoratus]|nr:hypothetical protein AcV5_010097 [Antrodia cinnamomea]KAI0920330.1 hypothetical protein AcV5_010097 [Antrodia cinnamomea]
MELGRGAVSVLRYCISRSLFLHLHDVVRWDSIFHSLIVLYAELLIPSVTECLSRSHPGMARHLNAAQYKNVFYQSTRHIAQHRTALAAPRSTLAFSVDICFIRIPFVLDCKRIFPTHNQPGAGERDRASRTH